MTRELTPKEREVFEREWDKYCGGHPVSGEYKAIAKAMFTAGLVCAEQQTNLAVAGAIEKAAKFCESLCDTHSACCQADATHASGWEYSGQHAATCPLGIAAAIRALTRADAAKALEAHDAQILTDLSFCWQKALCGIFGMEVICQGSIESIETFCAAHLAAHDKEVAAAAEEATHLEVQLFLESEAKLPYTTAPLHFNAASAAIHQKFPRTGALSRAIAQVTKPLTEEEEMDITAGFIEMRNAMDAFHQHMTETHGYYMADCRECQRHNSVILEMCKPTPPSAPKTYEDGMREMAEMNAKKLEIIAKTYGLGGHTHRERMLNAIAKEIRAASTPPIGEQDEENNKL